MHPMSVDLTGINEKQKRQKKEVELRFTTYLYSMLSERKNFVKLRQ